MIRSLWPGASERRILGRFYLAGFGAEALSVIPPFEFLFLFLVMDRPEWAVLPLLFERAAVLLMEVPTGAIADRFGRRRSVLLGEALSGVAFVAIPLATRAEGTAQLALVSAAFLVEGVGQSLVSGAEEAWVVDTLARHGRCDLVDRFFGRIRSFGSAGGVLAGVVAFVALGASSAPRAVLDVFWVLAGAGHLLSAAILRRVPDAPAQDDPEDSDSLSDAPVGRRTVAALRAIASRRPLLAIFAVGVVWALATSVTGDVLDLGLVGRGFDATYFALLGVGRDLVGALAPLAGVALARRFGFHRALVGVAVVPVLAAALLLVGPGPGGLVAIFLLFGVLSDLFDPIAGARLQATTPSAVRATVGSISNQARRLAEIAGIAVFALVLSGPGAALRAAMPGIDGAFESSARALPPGPLGVALPDLVLAAFTLVGLGVVPLLAVSRWNRPQSEEERLDDLAADGRPSVAGA